MTPHPSDRCPACGVRYDRWKGASGYTHSARNKGQGQTPHGVKADLWAVHVATCEAYSPDRVTFDPASFKTPTRPAGASADPSTRTLGYTLATLGAVAYADRDPVDDWGGDDDTEAEWSARMREARLILGADYARVTEAA